MADFTQTISNRLKIRYAVVGDQPSLWGTMVWGTGYWWGNYDTQFDILTGIDNSLSLTQTLGKDVGKWLSETATVTSRQAFVFAKGVPNSLTLTTSVSGVVTQGDWTRVERDVEVWTDVTGSDVTWTSATEADTTWSDS